MRKIGNTTSNRVFNPKNTQPPVPLDVDEVDAAMEKFIRQKYDQRTYSGGKTIAPATYARARQDTGSSDDQPPPPPPKPGRRFGFGLRSASSALPLSNSYEKSPPPTPDFPRKLRRAPSPIRINKQSRVFGASIGVTEDGMEWKLVQLREMGFPDDKRNTNILKGLNGDLERAIESLVRLGEGTTPASRTRTPNSARFPEVPRSKQTVGDSHPQQAPASAPQTAALPMQQPPQAEMQGQGPASGNLSSPMPTNQSYNPFDLAPPSAPFQQAALDGAFQNMHITQPLFPNATGGYPNQQQQLQQARVQQSMTPPVPQLPHQYSYNNPYAVQQATPSYNPFMNQTQQQSQPMLANPFLPSPQAAQPNSANPFPPSQQAPQATSANPFMPTQQTFAPHNPYQTQSSMNQAVSPAPQNQYQQSQQYQQQPQQYQQLSQQQPQQPQSQWPQQQFQQTYQESPQQLSSPQSFGQPLQSQQYIQSPSYPFAPNLQNQYQSPVQSLQPQQTGRYDKSSILALYNYPQFIPPIPSQDTNGSNATTSMSSSPQPQAAKLPQGVSGISQRSVTMPATSFSGTKNPFASSLFPTNPAGPSQMNGGGHQANQESLDAWALQNGRHSPDAFASLSARFVR